MAWPQATDYNAAIQNPQVCFGDPDLRAGQAVGDMLGLPRPHSGNFADVYQVQGSNGQSWAVKCFTREVHDLQSRYQAISGHLDQNQRPFMVDFHYLEQGIRIRGQWYPILKMRWVEGFRLNEFLAEQVDRPAVLERLTSLTVKLAHELREARMAHGDLQHGNILLVPGSKTGSLALRLIDYDGLFVPSLADKPSGEVGHPNYQHPQRLREGVYNPEVDRFSLLVIYTALRSLRVGGKKLWERHDNGENLLFREEDFRTPANSKLLPELWAMPDADVRALTGQLLLASQRPVAEAPLLDALLASGSIAPLSPQEEEQVRSLLRLPASGTTETVMLPPLPPREDSAGIPASVIAAIAIPALETVAVLEEVRPDPPSDQADLAARAVASEVGPTPPLPTLRWSTAAVGDYLLSRPWIMGGIAGSVLLLGLLTWLLWPRSTGAGSPPGKPADVVLLSVPEVTMQGGDKQTVDVKVQRQQWLDPLEVKVEGLPGNVKARKLVLQPFQEASLLELTAELTAEIPARPILLSLWRDGSRVSEQRFTLTVHKRPLPRLRPLQPVLLKAGDKRTLEYEIERKGSRDRVHVELKDLPPKVWQKSAEVKPDQPLPALLIGADADAPSTTGGIARLALSINGTEIDFQPLPISVEKAAPVPALVAMPLQPSLWPGKRDRIEVKVTRNGYIGPIEVRLQELPASVKSSAVTIGAESDAGVLELQAEDKAPAGTQRIRLAAWAGEVRLEPLELTLTVKKPAAVAVPMATRLLPTMQLGFHTIDGANIVGRYYPGTQGKKSGAVLLVPPIGQSVNDRAWQSLAEALQGKGYAVYSFNWRGHAPSVGATIDFWATAFPHNRLVPRPGRLVPGQLATLNEKTFSPVYLPHLADDLAGARHVLQEMNDRRQLNANHIILIAAGRGAAVAALWLSAEWYRFQTPQFFQAAPVNKDAEGKAIAAAVWLGMDPNKLGPRGSLNVESWLEHVGRTNRVPMLFLHGQQDAEATGRARAFAASARTNAVRLTTSKGIDGAAQSGMELLRPELSTQDDILKFLAAVEEASPPRAWEQIDFDNKSYSWRFPTAPNTPAKLAGQQQLIALPVDRMGVR